MVNGNHGNHGPPVAINVEMAQELEQGKVNNLERCITVNVMRIVNCC